MSASLRDRIQGDLERAMREHDEVARETLRMVVAGLENRRIELGRELEPADELDVLRKAVKTRQESVEQFARAGRAELADRERAEIAVVRRYLPRELSETETRALVEAIVRELDAASAADLPKVMKTVMARHKGQVDGKTVSRLAGELLGG